MSLLCYIDFVEKKQKKSKMNCYTNKYDITDESKLKSFFEQDGAIFSDVQNALWRAKNKNYTATFYKTAKLLIQGSNVTETVNKLNNLIKTKENEKVITENKEQDRPFPRIGVDESGKGDFFGPLVIAGVMVNKDSAELLIKAGVKDCKMVDDKNINRLSAIIKNNCKFSIVTINPTRYNELYEKFRNLNHLLAWGHARAIENILEKEECNYALSDKFGDEKLIKNALLQKGKNIYLEQRCKAESDIAVAAASIIARAQFLSTLTQLSQKYAIELPKGASNKVIEVAKEIKEKYTKEELFNISKTHFKTYSQI